MCCRDMSVIAGFRLVNYREVRVNRMSLFFLFVIFYQANFPSKKVKLCADDFKLVELKKAR